MSRVAWGWLNKQQLWISWWTQFGPQSDLNDSDVNVAGKYYQHLFKTQKGSEVTIHRNSLRLSNTNQSQLGNPTLRAFVCPYWKTCWCGKPRMRSIDRKNISRVRSYRKNLSFLIASLLMTAEEKRLPIHSESMIYPNWKWHTEAWPAAGFYLKAQMWSERPIARQSMTPSAAPMSTANPNVTLSLPFCFDVSWKLLILEKEQQKSWKVLDPPITDIRGPLWGEHVCQTLQK